MKNKTNIENMARTITMENLTALDADYQREDLMGLYTDICSELRRKAPDKEKEIYSYAAALQDEIDLFCPYEAYDIGAVFGYNPEPGMSEDAKKRLFLRYIRRIEFDPVSKEIHNKVCVKFNELCDLLGDTCGLISDFTELYRKCYGAIQEKIENFFDMGYASAQFAG